MSIKRLESGEWLDPPLVAFAASLMLAGTAASLGLLLATANGTLDLFDRPLGTDFSSFWTAGRMALDGAAAAAYDWPRHLAVQRALHGVDDYFPWSYPPLFLLVAAPLAMLPYVPALLLWQGASLAAAAAAFRAILPGRMPLVAGLGFPAVLVCLGHGQTGFLTAALFAGAVLALPRREVLAGVLFGLMAYKPQFGLVIPLALAAGGHWRAIAAAAATVAAAVAASLALWGGSAWQAFFEALPLTRRVVFEAGDTGFEKFVSLFAWVRLCGGPVTLAYAVQAAVAAAAVLATLAVWRGGADHRLKGAVLMVATLLASPYVLDYDLVLLGMALALIAAHGLDRGFGPWEKTLLAAAWLMPLAARPLQALLLPVGVLALAAVLAATVRRALVGTAAGSVPAGAGKCAIPGMGSGESQGAGP